MSAPTPALMVTGLGRCGSSLAMRMLLAGGLELVADGNGGSLYEVTIDPFTNPKEFRARLAPYLTGRAVKVLTPHRVRAAIPTPPGGWVAIYCSRGVNSQARSFEKNYRAAGYKVTRETAAKLRKSLRKEAPLTRAEVYRLSEKRVLDQRFQDVLHQPVETARKMAAFVLEHMGVELDVAEMALTVAERAVEVEHPEQEIVSGLKLAAESAS